MQLGFLSATQKQLYQRDGFLVLENFIQDNICQLLIQRACKLIKDYDANGLRTIFSSQDQQHAKQHYFLDSGDKIRFFFEENAFDDKGQLKQEKLYSINKIGHALHDLDPVFNTFSRSHQLATLASDLEIIDPLLIQSMYICKQPFIGGEVVPHQDSTYLVVEKGPYVTGFWFALENATLQNGCLWAIPGGHKKQLKSRFKRDVQNRTTMEVYDDSPWPLAEMIPLEVPTGSLIILHGLLPHMSKENLSSHSRHAYALHVISSQSQFAADNWLQRNDSLPFKGF